MLRKNLTPIHLSPTKSTLAPNKDQPNHIKTHDYPAVLSNPRQNQPYVNLHLPQSPRKTDPSHAAEIDHPRKCHRRAPGCHLHQSTKRASSQPDSYYLKSTEKPCPKTHLIIPRAKRVSGAPVCALRLPPLPQPLYLLSVSLSLSRSFSFSAPLHACASVCVCVRVR